MSATNWTKRTFTDGIILSPNTTPAVNPTSGVQVYAKADNKLYTLNSSGVEQAVGSGGSIVLVTQASHGFTSADVGRPLYLNSSTYTLARADVEATAEVAGLLNKVVDSNSIEVCLSGEVSSVGANLISGGGSLVPGEVYFLSPTEAGKITTTQPSVVGQISKPIGIARTTSAFDFYNMRGELVGSANAYTQIALSNNATTTIQNAAAYDSVELNGWIFISATIKYRYLFKAQVTKKGDGTDYLVSFQHSGDTPPDGFNITVTAAGLIQVSLPNLSGFSSAIAQFNLNGPAVGVSLPLQIESTNVSFSTIQAKNSSGIIFKNSSNTINSITINDSTGSVFFNKAPSTPSTPYTHTMTGTITTDSSGNATLQISTWSWGGWNTFKRGGLVTVYLYNDTNQQQIIKTLQSHQADMFSIATASYTGTGAWGATFNYGSNGSIGTRFFSLSGASANTTYNYTISFLAYDITSNSTGI